MKVELVKEIENNIDHVYTFYKVFVDGIYVSNTLTTDYDHALKIYEEVVKNNGIYKYKITEILKTTEI